MENNELPSKVVEPIRFDESELNAPVTVDDPCTASEPEVVPEVSENAPPVKRPTLLMLKRVELTPAAVVEEILKDRKSVV